MRAKIKNKDRQSVGELSLTMGRLEFRTDDLKLRMIFEEIQRTGLRTYDSLRLEIISIDAGDPSFISALADYLKKEGYVIDDAEEGREKLRHELQKFPDDDHVRELKSKIDSMSPLEINSLLGFIRSQSF